MSLGTSSTMQLSEERPDNQPAESADTQLYHIYHDRWCQDYKITTPAGQQLYYVDCSTFTNNKPDLTVHAGSNNKAPVAAMCKFMHFSRDFCFGLGDPELPAQVEWEDVVCQGLRRSHYRWQMNLPSGRRTFIWKRTHAVSVEDARLTSISYRNYKLVDEATGRILAAFTNDYLSIKKVGHFQVSADYGKEFDLIALLTVLGLYEKGSRRHKRIAAASAAASGG